jgi:hypothetical protein
MPIHQNNTRISIDFQYEFQLPDETSVVYNMKFMHTPQGPIVSIAQEGYLEAIELPADMFFEVYQFLNTQGVFRGKVSVGSPAPTINSGVSLPTINKRNTASKFPTLRGTGQPVVVDAQQDAPLVNLPNDVQEQPIDPEEAALIIKQRAEAKAKANVEKSKLRPNHKK